MKFDDKKIGAYSTKSTESDMRVQKIDPAIKAVWPINLIDTEHEITLDKGAVNVDSETGKIWRSPATLRPDYTLRFNEKIIAAFVEAKNFDKSYDHGISQARRYAQAMDTKFTYATNGKDINPQTNYGIKEYDFIKQEHHTRGNFPTPKELKDRLQSGGFGNELDFFLEPHEIPITKHPLRYYQTGAVNAVIGAIIKGEKKILLNLATGTGKTKIAYQIARKLWKHYLEPNGNHPKILFLTDRTALIDQAMRNDFAPFKGQMTRLIGKKTIAFDIYFSLYQSLDADKEDPEVEGKEYELYKFYDKNFFKYIIIDECHRGAQSEGGKWREILEYFDHAVHIGMTATPKADADSIDTFEYFGDAVYRYSEKQGVKDGFLAPHFLKWITLSHDVDGYRPKPRERGRNNQPLEDRIYEQDDYDKTIRVINRQKDVANKILKFLNTSPNSKYDKTILFCRDQQHANEMTQIILDESKEDIKYCVQITSNEGEEGRKQLAKFCDNKEKFPVIAVTSKLMTTGVDAQMCKLIVLDTNVNSKTELKQIIGRGTRIYDESKEMEKYYFTVMDFRNSTKRLEDPDWDSPALAEHVKTKKPGKKPETEPNFRPDVEGPQGSVTREVTKIYVPNAKTGYEYSEISEFIGASIRTLAGPLIEDFKNIWIDLEKRTSLLDSFNRKGISLENIREVENLTKDNYDLFDVFVKIVYDKKPKLRKTRVEQAKQDNTFFEKYPEKAQQVLNVLLDHYAEYGYQELGYRNVLQLEKFQKLGGPRTILTEIFNTPDVFDNAVKELMIRIYD